MQFSRQQQKAGAVNWANHLQIQVQNKFGTQPHERYNIKAMNQQV